jgi:ABC-type Zn2+ transport system substrate-binding protein/surface adhesin
MVCLGRSSIVRAENQTISLAETNGKLPCLVSNPQFLPSLFEITQNGTKIEMKNLVYDSRQGFNVVEGEQLNGKLLACTHGNVTKFIHVEGKGFFNCFYDAWK